MGEISEGVKVHWNQNWRINQVVQQIEHEQWSQNKDVYKGKHIQHQNYESSVQGVHQMWGRRMRMIGELHRNDMHSQIAQ